MEANELKGLLAIWTDIDEEFIPQFREWHSREHMPLRIPTPGWYVGHRYYGLKGAPGFLISYETSEASDLAGKAYHDSLNLPDARTREALSHYRNSVRTIYRLREAAGETLPTESRYYLTVRFDGGESPDALISWFGQTHLRRVCRIPGVRRARLYETDQGISHIMTEERRLYGAGPGKERFLAAYELESPDIPDSPVWKDSFTAVTSSMTDKIKEMRITHQDLFALEFTIYPPGKK
jgi:hypothetical protein